MAMAPSASMALAQDVLRPRQPGGLAPGAALALLVHAGLIAALTVSVDWRTQAPQMVSAELWAAVPQSAAPLGETPPAVAEPTPVPTPAPEPPPPVPPPPAPNPTPSAPPAPPAPPPAAKLPEPDIATEQLKAAQAKKLADAKALALAKAEQLKVEKLKADKLLADKLAAEKLAADKAKAERAKVDKAQAEKAKAEKLVADKAAAEKAKVEKAAAEKAAADKQAREAKVEEERLARQRDENLKRMMGQAGGATGRAGGTGTAAQEAGPSATYASAVAARIRRELVFTGNVPETAEAEVLVRAGASGTIIARTLTKSSGFRDWDEAVLRAIDKTSTLPRDVDGRVQSAMTLIFRRRE